MKLLTEEFEIWYTCKTTYKDWEMESIGMFEARTKFSEYIRAVAEEGREFMITNRGEDVARLIPARPVATNERVEAALARLAAIRANVVQPVLRPGESWNDFAREGLKW